MNWAISYFLVFWPWCLGTVMMPLDVSFSLLIKNQGLVEVDLSAILDPFDSNRFMLYSWGMSFFPKSCPPLPLLFHFHFSPSICHEVMGPDAMILLFRMLGFKPPFSLYSFMFIKRRFSSSLQLSSEWYHLHIWGCWYFSVQFDSSLGFIQLAFCICI